VANNDSEKQTNLDGGGVPHPAAVSFVTTEHFTLQGARSATIAEATGRASMFLGAVSGGLVAWGSSQPPRASAPRSPPSGSSCYPRFGLILLPTLVFVGLVTFDRTLQSGIEDYIYAQRTARLRGYYFRYAPELVDYLLSLPPGQRLKCPGPVGRILAAIRDGRGHGQCGYSRSRGLGSRPACRPRLGAATGRGAHRRRPRRYCGTARANASPNRSLASRRENTAVPAEQIS
jgi:hypothetical protein